MTTGTQYRRRRGKALVTAHRAEVRTHVFDAKGKRQVAEAGDWVVVDAKDRATAVTNAEFAKRYVAI